MPRATKLSKSPAPGLEEDLYGASPAPPSAQRQREDNNATQDTPSPNTSQSSDKENSSSRLAGGKGKERVAMDPPRISSDQNKRKRANAREPSPDRARRRRTVEQDDDESDLEYDPDQSIEERRRIRQGLRDLTKDLLEKQTEFMNPASNGIKDTLEKAEELANQVKQTSDATIDARLLVQISDASYKKTLALTSGDTSQGVDIEDFISKIKTYMRGNDAPADAEDDEEDNGDMLDWEFLGRNACVKHCLRPSVPGFLLGPLSVEKRAKRVVNRRAAFNPNSIKETRPEVVEVGDIEKNEDANLASLCVAIHKNLYNTCLNATKEIDLKIPEDLGVKEVDEWLDRYSVSRDGGHSLFKFVINPRSFGQTVENMFYTSFLIRDGICGIIYDDRGLPYLSKSFLRLSLQN